eukprot:2066398-Amphidinium_carterae.1
MVWSQPNAAATRLRLRRGSSDTAREVVTMPWAQRRVTSCRALHMAEWPSHAWQVVRRPERGLGRR